MTRIRVTLAPDAEIYDEISGTPEPQMTRACAGEWLPPATLSPSLHPPCMANVLPEAPWCWEQERYSATDIT